MSIHPTRILDLPGLAHGPTRLQRPVTHGEESELRDRASPQRTRAREPTYKDMRLEGANTYPMHMLLVAMPGAPSSSLLLVLPI